MRQDARRELCRTCGSEGKETGVIESRPQELYDEAGKQLIVDFPEIACLGGHNWFKGEGKERGIGGEDPILLEEHLHSRRRREIMCVQGVPDPEIVVGIYNRAHPQGRAVNNESSRKRGASFFK